MTIGFLIYAACVVAAIYFAVKLTDGDKDRL